MINLPETDLAWHTTLKTCPPYFSPKQFVLQLDMSDHCSTPLWHNDVAAVLESIAADLRAEKEIFEQKKFHFLESILANLSITGHPHPLDFSEEEQKEFFEFRKTACATALFCDSDEEQGADDALTFEQIFAEESDASVEPILFEDVEPMNLEDFSDVLQRVQSERTDDGSLRLYLPKPSDSDADDEV